MGIRIYIDMKIELNMDMNIDMGLDMNMDTEKFLLKKGLIWIRT